ncbi:MAG: aspartate aminotransferase family protein [Actinomycetota bacterium]
MNETTVSQSLEARANRVIPGGVNSVMRRFDPSLVIRQAKGGHLTTEDGKRLMDLHAAFGPIVLGHGNEAVARAVTEATSRNDLVGVGPNLPAVELAERVVDLVPSVDKLLLCNSGSEATFHAVRLARAATGRRLVVKFHGGYHGWHDYLALGSRAADEGAREPFSAGLPSTAFDEVAVLGFNDTAGTKELFAERGDEVAAVIVEPVLHTIGCVLPEPGFLETLREETSRVGAVLIFDEVVTGFRHHLGGYQTQCGVTPDLTTLAKAMANGYPVAAVGGSDDLMSMFAPGGGPVFFGGTYNGHPGMAAAALATIGELERRDAHQHLYRLGARAQQGLTDAAARAGVDVVVQSHGSVFSVYFGTRPVTSLADALETDLDRYVAFHRGMIERGFFMVPLPLKRNHLMVEHTESDVDALVEAAADVFSYLAARR